MPNPPNLERTLILETSGNAGRVGLACGRKLLAEGSLSRERRRASDLTAICEKVLSDQGWKPSDLTAVIVGLGPGSYTALRVGVASAKMLAYAIGGDFVGVETFAACAVQAEGSRILVVADALQGEVYLREYSRSGTELMPVSPLEIRPIREVKESLGADVVVTGPGEAMITGPERGTESKALALEALLAVAHDHSWAVVTDMWTAEPHYLRGSSAEEKKKKDRSTV